MDEIMAGYLASEDVIDDPGVLTLVILRARKVDFSPKEGHGIRLVFVTPEASKDDLAALNVSAWYPVGEIGGAYTHLIRSGDEFWAAVTVWI